MDAIAVVPYDYFPDSWGEYLQPVQESTLLHVGVIPTDAQIDNELRIKLIWSVVLHHVIKNWRSKHRIPCPRKLVKTIKPLGDLATSYFDLCIQCHAFLPAGIYENAGHWFALIMREFQINDSDGLPNYQCKTSALSRDRETYQKLYEGINPIDPEVSPHLYKLIQSCIGLLDEGRCDRFDRQCWQPFLKSYRQWNTAKQSPEWTTIFEDICKLYCRGGRGKGRYLLFPQKTISITLAG
ncbi:hypothetical protein [Nostoc sp.]